jgi:hypothetical protein
MSAWTYNPDTGQVDEPGGTVVQPGAISWQPHGVLIASAPVLAAICVRLTERLEYLVDEGRCGLHSELEGECIDLTRAARKVLARAEGR